FRKQASDLAVQVEVIQLQLAHLKSSQTTAKAQQKAVEDAIAQLKDQSATIDKAWKEMNSRIQAQQQLAGEILGSGGSARPAPTSPGIASDTISQKPAELVNLVAEQKKMRAEAITKLNNAADKYADAKNA